MRRQQRCRKRWQGHAEPEIQRCAERDPEPVVLGDLFGVANCVRHERVERAREQQERLEWAGDDVVRAGPLNCRDEREPGDEKNRNRDAEREARNRVLLPQRQRPQHDRVVDRYDGCADPQVVVSCGSAEPELNTISGEQRKTPRQRPESHSRELEPVPRAGEERNDLRERRGMQHQRDAPGLVYDDGIQDKRDAGHLSDETARRVAERRTGVVIFDKDARRHVLLVFVDADEHQRERSVRLGSEVEANPRASLLREKLVDYLARKMASSLTDPVRTPANERLGFLVRDDVAAGRSGIGHRVLRERSGRATRCRPGTWW